MGFYESLHHLDALRVLKNAAFDSISGEQLFSAFEVLIFADDHFRNLVQQRGSAAHDARAERADQHQLVPVPAASGVADADHFTVSRGVASLNSQIATARDDFATEIGQN